MLPRCAHGARAQSLCAAHSVTDALVSSTDTRTIQKGSDDLGKRFQKLAEIHGWFSEGFDTADVKDAKALLEEPS